jgi:ParB family chromosome partitioning protein
MDDIQEIGRVVWIRRTKIRPFKDQPRKYFSQIELQNLANSIREIGQRTPIEVRELPDGGEHGYELVDGQRRWHACGIAGVEFMKAVIVKVDNADDQFVMSVIANFGRVDHDHVEAALAIDRICRTTGKNQTQVANVFAKTPAWVSQHLKLLKLVPEIRELMAQSRAEEDRLLFSSAVILADLPHDVQRKMLSVIMRKGLSVSEIKAAIRRRAAMMGVVVGGERGPRHDYAMLRTFMRRTKRDADTIAGIGSDGVRRMFAARSADDSKQAVVAMRECLASVKSLYAMLRKAEKREGK